MPAVSSPPVLINRSGPAVGVEYLGAAPGVAGTPGIVAERVGHVHALGRAQRAIAGMGLYADVNPTHDGCDAYLTTAAGALPAVTVWTWETWFLGPTLANVTYSAGVYAQGTAASTANPNGLILGLENSGGGGGPTVFRCPDGTTISLGVLSAIMYHVAAVYNGVTIKVYLNGVLQGTHTPSSSAAIAAAGLAGFGASATNSSGGRMRLAETRLSNIPRFTAPFTPQQTPYTPDSATVGLWSYSDIPLGNWGIFYETGGTSPAPGGQPLPAGWHWTPSATFDGGPNGLDLGIALHLYTIIADLGSVIYSCGPAGITSSDGVLRSPSVTSLQAQNGDLVLEDGSGNHFAVTPGAPSAASVITIPTGIAGLGFEHNDVTVATEAAIDLEDSGTVTWTLTDDPSNGRVKVSAAASGGGGGGPASGGSLSGLLAQVSYSTFTAYSTSSATFSAMDSTNLSATFSAPASGRVVIRLHGHGSVGNVNTYLQWGVGPHGGSASAGENVSNLTGSTGAPNVHEAEFIITGLTPGTSYTYDWFHASSDGSHSVNTYAGPGAPGSVNQGPAIMEVYDGTIGGVGDFTWQTPTLLNSWANLGSPYGNAAYRKDALGFVHLAGVIKSGTIGSAAFTLPAGYRPLSTRLFAIDAHSAFGELTVDSSGNVTVSVGANNYCQLDGITFLGEQ